MPGAPVGGDRHRRAPASDGGSADAAGLEVGQQTLGAELPAEAGLLEPAERHQRERRVAAVDGDAAGAHPAGDREAARVVAGPHAARQAVAGVVGDADRVVLAVERDERQHGAEDLLAGDPHAVVHVGQDRRWHVPAAREVGGPGAAGDDAGALVDGRGDVALDPGPLALGDERARRRSSGRTGRRRGCLGGGAGRLDRLVVAVAGHEDAGVGAAHLARQVHAAAHDAGDGDGEVGVVAHDGGGLAAELERHPGDPLGAAGHDPLAGVGGAGEGDLVDARVGTRCSPASRPPGTTLTAPSGTPASASASASTNPLRGASGGGLSTTCSRRRAPAPPSRPPG